MATRSTTTPTVRTTLTIAIRRGRPSPAASWRTTPCRGSRERQRRLRADARSTGNDSANSLTGGAGTDGMVGRKGNDYLNGNEGNDFLEGNSRATNWLTGGEGSDDTLEAHAGQRWPLRRKRHRTLVKLLRRDRGEGDRPARHRDQNECPRARPTRSDPTSRTSRARATPTTTSTDGATANKLIGDPNGADTLVGNGGVRHAPGRPGPEHAVRRRATRSPSSSSCRHRNRRRERRDKIDNVAADCETVQKT